MKWKKSLAAIPLVLGVGFGVQEASAALCLTPTITGYTTADLTPEGPQTGDVAFGAEDSDSCAGVFTGGNQGDASLLAAIQALYGTSFQQGPKADDVDGTSTGAAPVSLGGSTYVWSITAVESTNPGTWSLDVAGALPIEVDIVALFKQSRGFATFLFTDEDFTVADASGQGTFVIRWCPGNPPDTDCNNLPGTDISHLSIYVGNPTYLPDPGSLPLLGLGLAGLAFIRRRRV